jgi:hypothetical protein
MDLLLLLLLLLLLVRQDEAPVEAGEIGSKVMCC